MTTSLTLEVYSDYVCPWCYLSTPRIDRLAANFKLDVKWMHYPLHPETPPEGFSLASLQGDAEFADEQKELRRLMAEEGLPYGHRTMTFNSRMAQELSLWAEWQPGGQRVHDALFRAYFADSVNLSDPQLLLGIVEVMGLDVDDARDSLKSGRYAPMLDQQWAHAKQSGIRGVPTFLVGELGVVGAQPYDELEEFVLVAGAVRRDFDEESG